MRWLIIALLLIPLVSADLMIYNGHNTSETQIGNMKADMWANGVLIKASLTDGQPISRNGTYGTSSGQIGYLSLITVTPSGPSPPIPVVYNVSLHINMTVNQTYYSIGDTVLIWANINKNSTINEIWLFTSDGNASPFTYLITYNKWFIYHKVTQSQEYLISVSYDTAYTATGFGDIVVTVNPNPTTPSMWTQILVNLGFIGASGGLIIIIIIVLLFILIIAKMLIQDRLTPKPLAPLNPGRTSNFGKVGSASMSGLSGIRNSAGFIFQLIFTITTIIIIIAIILIGLYILRLLHIL